MLPLRRSLLLGAVSAALLSPAAAAPRLIVAYPPEGHRVAYDHVILEGSVSPGARLTIGGRAAEVAPDGLYTLWWPLSPGLNTLRLVTTVGGESSSRVLHVTRTVTAPLPARPTALRPGSLTPTGRMEFWDPAGDSPAERQLEVSFEGSPGAAPVSGWEAAPRRPCAKFVQAATAPPGCCRSAVCSTRRA